MESKSEEIKRPVNQKSIYHSAGMLFEMIMNNKIDLDKANAAVKALNVMNVSYANELKRATIEHKAVRIIEIKNFESIPIEESKPESESELMKKDPN
jgi:hypothetical protein